VRVAPDVERSISKDDETGKGVLVDSMFVEPPSELAEPIASRNGAKKHEAYFAA